jgi:hypothetical protein
MRSEQSGLESEWNHAIELMAVVGKNVLIGGPHAFS